MEYNYIYKTINNYLNDRILNLETKTYTHIKCTSLLLNKVDNCKINLNNLQKSINKVNHKNYNLKSNFNSTFSSLKSKKTNSSNNKSNDDNNKNKDYLFINTNVVKKKNLLSTNYNASSIRESIIEKNNKLFTRKLGSPIMYKHENIHNNIKYKKSKETSNVYKFNAKDFNMSNIKNLAICNKVFKSTENIDKKSKEISDKIVKNNKNNNDFESYYIHANNNILNSKKNSVFKPIIKSSSVSKDPKNSTNDYNLEISSNTKGVKKLSIIENTTDNFKINNPKIKKLPVDNTLNNDSSLTSNINYREKSKSVTKSQYKQLSKLESLESLYIDNKKEITCNNNEFKSSNVNNENNNYNHKNTKDNKDKKNKKFNTSKTMISCEYPQFNKPKESDINKKLHLLDNNIQKSIAIMCSSKVVPFKLRATLHLSYRFMNKVYSISSILNDYIEYVELQKNNLCSNLNIYLNNKDVKESINKQFVPSKTLYLFLNLINQKNDIDFISQYTTNNITEKTLNSSDNFFKEANLIAEIVILLLMNSKISDDIKLIKKHFDYIDPDKNANNSYINKYNLKFSYVDYLYNVVLPMYGKTSIKELILCNLILNIHFTDETYFKITDIVNKNSDFFNIESINSNQSITNNLLKILPLFINEVIDFGNQITFNGVKMYTLRYQYKVIKLLIIKISMLKTIKSLIISK